MSADNQKIYAVSAIFEKPDEIMHAARKVRDSEYSKFDVHTPYPVHGMDHAMGLKPTKVPYVTLVFGLLGLAAAFTLQTGIMAGDYKINIGGKPFFSLPAFMPIMFELTVLFATLATVFFMVTIFCKLPQNSLPLHDTDYMKAVMRDKFGVTIEASDENFNEEKVRKFLEKIGSNKVETIYYKEVEE
ncbi:MAG: hypothetical protein COA79_08090 [Planctomycetota bacterium]|nr:MAG: hypothetical protein COA79_08090 [Planctomycetota bacterium]